MTLLSREQNGRVFAAGGRVESAAGAEKQKAPESGASAMCCHAIKHKVLGGADGARTRDPRRDRPVF